MAARKKKPSRVKERENKPQKTTECADGKYAYLNEVAYVIVDSRYGSFEVRKTANGWWKDKAKVERLISARKLGANKKTACYHAGIYPTDMASFVKNHPHFSLFLSEIKENPKLKALMAIFAGLDNPENAKWYLERKCKDEFSKRSELTGRDGKAFMAKDLTEAEIKAAIAGAQAMLDGSNEDDSAD